MFTVVLLQKIAFCSQIKCWLSGLEFIKYLSEKQIGKILIRLFLQKQSGLVLHCLSRPFGQATSVQNLRRFTVTVMYFYHVLYPTSVFKCIISHFLTVSSLVYDDFINASLNSSNILLYHEHEKKCTCINIIFYKAKNLFGYRSWT